MSTLHERLLAEPDIWTREAQSDPTGAVDRLAAAVRAVVELHAPIPCGLCSLRHEHQRCRWCTGFTWPATESLSSWPCPTIESIAEALGIGETPK